MVSATLQNQIQFFVSEGGGGGANPCLHGGSDGSRGGGCKFSNF